MAWWQAIFLGLIQGLTEFLPVSSSGHLALSEYFLGFENLQNLILFDLVCHLGTLTAIIYFFFPAIKESLQFRSPKFWLIVLATLPLFPLLLILKPIKALFNQIEYLGPFFILSAILLFSGIHLRLKSQASSPSWKGALFIGAFQSVAILPGVSRSGATISAATFLGWKREEAITFSFLLAIPTILGGAFIEALQLCSSTNASCGVNTIAYVIGFVTSCIVGLCSLSLLVKIAEKNKWHYFGWYCLILGCLTTYYFIFVN